MPASIGLSLKVTNAYIPNTTAAAAKTDKLTLYSARPNKNVINGAKTAVPILAPMVLIPLTTPRFLGNQSDCIGPVQR